MLNFVEALNQIHGIVWLNFVVILGMLLVFARYRKQPARPAGSLIDVLNSVHPAVYGFIFGMSAIALMLVGHSAEGEKVFLSGASFIGGVALRGSYKGGDATPSQSAVIDVIKRSATGGMTTESPNL
ncbi:MAG TPA: hypothetical protein VHA06_08095 [Candidatus Angelobacter sp.]|jgi:hypothetical protein|nr:hypothetical protein [Candidatus Angelobacter sp.]